MFAQTHSQLRSQRALTQEQSEKRLVGHLEGTAPGFQLGGVVAKIRTEGSQRHSFLLRGTESLVKSEQALALQQLGRQQLQHVRLVEGRFQSSACTAAFR